MEVIKDEFYPRGHTNPIEDLEQIISHDLLMIERGWSPRRVAFVVYAITIFLAVVAWFGQQFGLRGFSVLSGLSLAGLLILAIRLGCLRAEQPGTALQGPLLTNRADPSSFR